MGWQGKDRIWRGFQKNMYCQFHPLIFHHTTSNHTTTPNFKHNGAREKGTKGEILDCVISLNFVQKHLLAHASSHVQ
jgi:hypothetical protein